SSRHLVVRDGDRVIAETRRPVVLYESGFAPRWYVPRGDVDPSALTAVEGQTFCPYKGLASYYDIGQRRRAAWSYLEAWPEVARVSGFVSLSRTSWTSTSTAESWLSKLARPWSSTGSTVDSTPTRYAGAVSQPASQRRAREWNHDT